jgi:hypothetical protein
MINRRLLLSNLALITLQARTAFAQQVAQAGSPFSFAVYGDSRSMMYLPYKLDQREEAINLMVDIFDLVLPEKVSEDVVRKNVRLTYDPTNDELVQIVMPFDTRSEVTTLTVDKGWITEASVEDVKLLPRRAPHDVPALWRRVGRTRDRERCTEWASQVHSQYGGHGLVGQAGTYAL